MNLLRKVLHSLKISPGNHGLMATIYFAFCASGFMAISLGTLLPYLKDEHALSYSQSGLMLSVHQFGNLCAVLVAGWLPYVIGRKKSTLIMGIGTAIGMTLMALTGNPWLLVAAFALTGIGRGTMSNICNVVISDISANKTGAMNLLHAVFAIGALTSPLVVRAFTQGSAAGWHTAALFIAATSLAAWICLFRSKLSNVPASKKKDGSAAFLKSPHFWVDTLILFFYLCAEASIIGWFVVYFEEMGVLSSGVAKLTPTLLWVMIMIGRLSCAAISSRIDKNKLLFILGVLFSLSFAGLMFSNNAASCLICLIGVGFSMAGVYPTLLSATRDKLSTMSTGVLIATANFGAILMPSIIGAVADSYGLGGGVALVLIALFIMVALMAVKLVSAVKDAKKNPAPKIETVS